MGADCVLPLWVARWTQRQRTRSFGTQSYRLRTSKTTSRRKHRGRETLDAREHLPAPRSAHPVQLRLSLIDR
jgi:hypothetical protein